MQITRTVSQLTYGLLPLQSDFPGDQVA